MGELDRLKRGLIVGGFTYTLYFTHCFNMELGISPNRPCPCMTQIISGVGEWLAVLMPLL